MCAIAEPEMRTRRPAWLSDTFFEIRMCLKICASRVMIFCWLLISFMIHLSYVLLQLWGQNLLHFQNENAADARDDRDTSYGQK